MPKYLNSLLHYTSALLHFEGKCCAFYYIIWKLELVVVVFLADWMLRQSHKKHTGSDNQKKCWISNPWPIAWVHFTYRRLSKHSKTPYKSKLKTKKTAIYQTRQWKAVGEQGVRLKRCVSSLDLKVERGSKGSTPQGSRTGRWCSEPEGRRRIWKVWINIGVQKDAEELGCWGPLRWEAESYDQYDIWTSEAAVEGVLVMLRAAEIWTTWRQYSV